MLRSCTLRSTPDPRGGHDEAEHVSALPGPRAGLRLRGLRLRTERFHEALEIEGIVAAGDGPIKTFPLRGIVDSPPYLHDGRLLTLEDTVEFFNLVLGTKLDAREKGDLVAFLRCL